MQVITAYLEAASTAYGHVRKNLLTAQQKNMANWTITGNLVIEYDEERNLNTVTIPQEAGQYLAPDGNYYKYYYWTTINSTYYDMVKVYSNKPLAIMLISGGAAYFYDYTKTDNYQLQAVYSNRNGDHHHYGADIWTGTYLNGELLENFVLNVAVWNNGGSQYVDTNIPKVAVEAGDTTAQKYWRVRKYLTELTMRRIQIEVTPQITYNADYEFMFDMCCHSGATYYLGADTDTGVRFCSYYSSDGDLMPLPLTQSSQLVEYTLEVTADYTSFWMEFFFSELDNNDGNVVFEIENLRLYKAEE